MKKIFLWSMAILVIGVVAFGIFLASKSPSHDRQWKTEYKVLPSVEFDDGRVTVKNVRNFAYSPDGGVQKVRYYDRTFDIDTLESAWYGISHFAGGGLAHTFLSFGFQDGQYVTISVEARQEVGESYHPLTGLLRNYELAYIVGDERDIVGLRTHIRKEKVYLYRLTIPPETARRVFQEMLEIVEDIHRTPRFYNTLFDNCTSNLIDRAEGLSVFERHLDYRVLLPGYSDELAYEKGVIRTDIPLETLRKASLLDSGRCEIDAKDFSAKIRGGV